MNEGIREELEKQFPKGYVVVGFLPNGKLNMGWSNNNKFTILDMVKTLVVEFGDPDKVVTVEVRERI